MSDCENEQMCHNFVHQQQAPREHRAPAAGTDHEFVFLSVAPDHTERLVLAQVSLAPPLPTALGTQLTRLIFTSSH